MLEIDPRYAPAWLGLARNLINKAFSGIVSSQEGYPRARELAEKALAIDPDYAPAHATLGYIATVENDDAGAAKHYERALALDPTDPVAQCCLFSSDPAPNEALWEMSRLFAAIQ